MQWFAIVYVMVTHVVCHWVYVMAYVIVVICHEDMSSGSLYVIGYVINTCVMTICHKNLYICHQDAGICHGGTGICHYAYVSSGYVIDMIACVIGKKGYVIEHRGVEQLYMCHQDMSL